MPLAEDPGGEAAEQHQPEHQEGRGVEQRVGAVAGRAPRAARDDQQLARVQEDGVDLDHEAERHEGHELCADQSEVSTVASQPITAHLRTATA